MKSHYEKHGYILAKQFFNKAELRTLLPVSEKFHGAWQQENAEFYKTRAVNSAYLTSAQYLSSSERQTLFNFIGSNKLVALASELIPDGPAFMNTQLFFNPVQPEQKNYWHRDIQYTNSPIAEQQQALHDINVIHFRVALQSEYGIELVPGSHENWDTPEEHEIRMERKGHKNHEPLQTGHAIPLEPGDLLVFSANMIHRGLYGKNRMALDILFCDADPDLLQFANPDCMPSNPQLSEIENPLPFTNSLKIMKN